MIIAIFIIVGIALLVLGIAFFTRNNKGKNGGVDITDFFDLD